MKHILLIMFSLLALVPKTFAQQNDPKFGKIKVRKYVEPQFYVEIDYVPEYAAGPNALLDDIQAGIIYPEAAVEEKLKGVVMVEVVIDKFGNVNHTEISQSPHKELNRAALAAAKSLGKFAPHMEKGMVVPAKFVLPVEFFLPL